MNTRHDPLESATATATAATAEPVALSPNAVATGSRRRKISVAAIPSAKTETKTAYPIFPDANGQAAIIAQRIKERSEELDALTGALETDKAELKMLVSPFYFKTNHQKKEVPSSIAIKFMSQSEHGRVQSEVLVSYQNRYNILVDDMPLVGIMGEEMVDTLFKQTFTIKIKSDLLPQGVNEATQVPKAQELIDKITQLFTDYNCLEAMELKDGILPTKEFHAQRHLQLTPEQNLQVEEICPIIAQIKTKGRQ